MGRREESSVWENLVSSSDPGDQVFEKQSLCLSEHVARVLLMFQKPVDSLDLWTYKTYIYAI